MTRAINDINGRRFGKLLVQSFSNRDQYRKTFWNCVCDCGGSAKVARSNLLSGNSTSCGCDRIARITTHGNTKGRKHTPEYAAWTGMIARCGNSAHADYPRYGGVGIKVCNEWRDFRQFLEDVGPKPSAGFVLARISTKDDYAPSNCVWRLKAFKRGPDSKQESLREIESGSRVGRLVAKEKVRKPNGNPNQHSWRCVCDCGASIIVQTWQLRWRHKVSCGCLKREGKGPPPKSHGKSNTREYTLFISAKHRATNKNIPFSITLEDIVIPEICPVLGIPLLCKGRRDNRPSLDQLIPGLGYIPDNIKVISLRANRIKSDATAEELERLVAYVKSPLR